MACKGCIRFEMCDRTDMKGCPHFKDRSQFVKVVHGRCKFCEDYGKFGEIVCYLPTENGDAIAIPLNHCPNCGARMDGKGERNG